MRLGRDVGGLLVALHAAAEDAVDAVGLGEDGRVADRQAGAEAQAEHCGTRWKASNGPAADANWPQLVIGGKWLGMVAQVALLRLIIFMSY